VEMKKFPRRSVRFPSVEDDESGDEAELAKKIATLKWHSKEMEVCANYSAYFICAAKMPIHEIYLF
jgi:hypothetical protein